MHTKIGAKDGYLPPQEAAGQANVREKKLSLRSKVFRAGFGLSLPLLILEYLTGGRFPGWLILVPSNPTTLAAALVARSLESVPGPRWSDEAFFGTFILESAFWWYLVGGAVDVIRRRRSHRAKRPSVAWTNQHV